MSGGRRRMEPAAPWARPLQGPAALLGRHLSPLPPELLAALRRQLVKARELLANALLLLGRQPPELLPSLPDELALLWGQRTPLLEALLRPRALFR
jgi:hypothetical protein